MCGATRLLLPAFLVGVSVSTLTSNDLLGWAAAAATVVGLLAWQKIRGTSPSCAIRGAAGPAETSERPAERVITGTAQD
jgi:hypothetical protein